VSQPPAEPAHLPPASEQQVRSHAAELVQLAARHRIAALAFASPGRLHGHVADDRDLVDMFEFQWAAADLPGAEVTVYSDPEGRWATSTLVQTSPPSRPCQRRPPGPHALPGPESSPGTTQALHDEGDVARSGRESRDRRVLHRLRIAVGNEALVGTTADQDLGLAALCLTHMPVL
jgi:hypothetical protein